MGACLYCASVHSSSTRPIPFHFNSSPRPQHTHSHTQTHCLISPTQNCFRHNTMPSFALLCVPQKMGCSNRVVTVWVCVCVLCACACGLCIMCGVECSHNATSFAPPAVPLPRASQVVVHRGEPAQGSGLVTRAAGARAVRGDGDAAHGTPRGPAGGGGGGGGH